MATCTISLKKNKLKKNLKKKKNAMLQKHLQEPAFRWWKRCSLSWALYVFIYCAHCLIPKWLQSQALLIAPFFFRLSLPHETRQFLNSLQPPLPSSSTSIILKDGSQTISAKYSSTSDIFASSQCRVKSYWSALQAHGQAIHSKTKYVNNI